METYKSRLVTTGHRQCYGIDYDEIFFSVEMLKSIQIMIALAAYLNYKIKQINVQTAFLNSKLDEEVYMIQPGGFTSTGESMVCKLHRSIYNLKQASQS